MYVGTLGALGSCFRGSQGVMTGDFQHEIYLEHGTHAGNVVCTVHPAPLGLASSTAARMPMLNLNK